MKDSVVRLWGLALCLVLSGCSALHVAERKVRNMEEPAASPALDRMHDVRSRYGGRLSHGLVTQPERVTLDDADDWLRFAVGKGGFETAPLPVAVDMLVGRRPMRFSPGMEALLVSEPVSVQTVQEALDALALQADVAYEMADGRADLALRRLQVLAGEGVDGQPFGQPDGAETSTLASPAAGAAGAATGAGAKGAAPTTRSLRASRRWRIWWRPWRAPCTATRRLRRPFRWRPNALNVRGRPSSVRAAEAVWTPSTRRLVGA